MVDLVINGTTTALYGIQNYGNVEVKNGGILYITPYNGTPDTGTLEIHANNILVDATSQIIADVRGFRGGNGTAAAAGGADYYTPGSIYGTESGTDITWIWRRM